MTRYLLGPVFLFCLSLVSMGAFADALDCNGCIDTRDIGKKQVTKRKFSRNAVNSARVKNDSLKGKDIKDGTLGSADLADGSVTGAKIADGAITAADIDPALLADLANDKLDQQLEALSTPWWCVRPGQRPVL